MSVHSQKRNNTAPHFQVLTSHQMIRKMVPIHQPITFQSNIVEKNSFHSFVERMLGISDHIKLFNSSEQAMKESRTLI